MRTLFVVGFFFLSACHTAPPRSFNGLDLAYERAMLLATVNELRLIELQRFVPPAGVSLPTDEYSLTLDSSSQRLYDLTHQHLGPALTDLLSATSEADQRKARGRVFVVCTDVMRELREFPVDEWNEARYVQLIGAQIVQLGMAVRPEVP